MASSYDVSGRVALVTGAARGIGYETARALYERGASVAVLDLDAGEAEAAAERVGADRTLALAADVTDAAAMEAAVEATVERFGGLDIVVANAGIAPPTATMRVANTAAWERVVDVDLLGVWRTVRAGLPQVVERGGHIVVVASVYAFMNGALASPYAVAKAGVEQLGRALRVELVQHGASASVAYFGFIDTDMVRDAFSDPVAKRFEEQFPKFMSKRLPPSAAGEAIAQGIERRAPRIIRPRWWRVWSVLRGVLNPVFDTYLERDQETIDILREADVPERAAERTGGLPAP